MIVYLIHCCGAKCALCYLGVLCAHKSLRGLLWAWLTYNNECHEQLPCLFRTLVECDTVKVRDFSDLLQFVRQRVRSSSMKVHLLQVISAAWNHLVLIIWLFYNHGYLYAIVHTAVYSGVSYFLCSPKWKELRASMTLLMLIASTLAVVVLRVLVHPDWPERWTAMFWFFYTYGMCCGVLYTSAYDWGKDLLPVNVLYDLLALLLGSE